jgi:hypothetical protein
VPIRVRAAVEQERGDRARLGVVRRAAAVIFVVVQRLERAGRREDLVKVYVRVGKVKAGAFAISVVAVRASGALVRCRTGWCCATHDEIDSLAICSKNSLKALNVLGAGRTIE